MSPALTQILQQAELRSRDGVLRLVEHVEWLTDRPESPIHVVHRQEEMQAFNVELLGVRN